VGEGERRRDMRIKTAFEIVNAIPPLEGVAYLSDASAGSAHLEESSAQPPLGESVQLTVRLPDGPAPLVLVGKVMRHTPSGFGVAFDKPCARLGRLVDAESADGPPFERALSPADGQHAIDAERRVGSFAERRVQCLLPYAILEGTLDVLDKIRISDHLMRCSAFIAVRDCQVRLARSQRAPRDLSRVAIALVNLRRVFGVSDLAASPPPPEEAPPLNRR